MKKLIKKLPLLGRVIDFIIRKRTVGKRIEFIRTMLPKNGIGAELGVFKGWLSPVLLKETQAKELHLVDPWYLLGANWDWAAGNQGTVHGLMRTLKVMEKPLSRGQVVIQIGFDLDVLNAYPERYFDWVYIDSSHTFEHTCNELAICSKKIREGGVIAGDDWNEDQRHPHHGVYLAVRGFLAERRDYKLIYKNTKNGQWAIENNRRSF